MAIMTLNGVARPASLGRMAPVAGPRLAAAKPLAVRSFQKRPSSPFAAPTHSRRCISSAAQASAAAAPASENDVVYYGPHKPWGIGIAASIAGALRTAAERLSTAFQNATNGAEIDPEDVKRQVKTCMKSMKYIWAIAPFAAVGTSSSANTFLLITRAVASFIKLYLLLLFLRVLLSWFPTFDWMQQPWLALRQVTDPYLNLFRGIVPPLLGTIDFTPLLGFFILQFLAGALDLGYEEDSW